MGNATQPIGFKQIIYSEPLWVPVETYLTKKGQRLFDTKAMPVADIWAKYGKTRYRKNPFAVPVKIVYHPKLDKFGKLMSYYG